MDSVNYLKYSDYLSSNTNIKRYLMLKLDFRENCQESIIYKYIYLPACGSFGCSQTFLFGDLTSNFLTHVVYKPSLFNNSI